MHSLSSNFCIILFNIIRDISLNLACDCISLYASNILLRLKLSFFIICEILLTCSLIYIFIIILLLFFSLSFLLLPSLFKLNKKYNLLNVSSNISFNSFSFSFLIISSFFSLYVFLKSEHLLNKI